MHVSYPENECLSDRNVVIIIREISYLFGDYNMDARRDVLFAAFAFLTAVLIYDVVTQCFIYLLSMLLVFLGYRYLKNALKECVDCTGKSVLITGCDTVKYTFYVGRFQHVCYCILTYLMTA